MLADDDVLTEDVEKTGSGTRMLLRLACKVVIFLEHKYVMSACTGLSSPTRLVVNLHAQK